LTNTIAKRFADRKELQISTACSDACGSDGCQAVGIGTRLVVLALD
jgi:hypothetical protein